MRKHVRRLMWKSWLIRIFHPGDRKSPLARLASARSPRQATRLDIVCWQNLADCYQIALDAAYYDRVWQVISESISRRIVSLYWNGIVGGSRNNRIENIHLINTKAIVKGLV